MVPSRGTKTEPLGCSHTHSYTSRFGSLEPKCNTFWLEDNTENNSTSPYLPYLESGIIYVETPCTMTGLLQVGWCHFSGCQEVQASVNGNGVNFRENKKEKKKHQASSKFGTQTAHRRPFILILFQNGAVKPCGWNAGSHNSNAV